MLMKCGISFFRFNFGVPGYAQILFYDSCFRHNASNFSSRPVCPFTANAQQVANSQELSGAALKL